MIAAALEIPVATIATFSADGRVFRAFNHLVAARHGQLLLVPLGRTSGDLRPVVDGCPVPWEEILAMLDVARQMPLPVAPELLCHDYPALALLTPYGWMSDRVLLGSESAPPITRLTHATGIRFARVDCE